MKKEKDEGMGNRLDQINDVICNLLNGLNVSRTESEVKVQVSPMESFCDSLLEYREDEYSYMDNGIQSGLIDKFQDMLTENDRLRMQVEDFCSHGVREQESSFEFLLNQEQIKSLNLDTQNFLQQDEPNALLRIGKNCFILESTQKTGKIIYFTEGIGDSLPQKNSGAVDLENKNTSFEVVKLRAQVEKDYLALAKKQEQVRSLQEQLGFKIQELETLKNDYHQKIADIGEKPYPKAKKCKKYSDELYTSYYSENKKRPSDLSFILRDCGNTPKNLAKESFLDSFSSDAPKDLSVHNISHIKPFNESFILYTKSKNKENYVIDYIREQSVYQAKKIQELKEYETYLQETWVDAFGHDKAVTALQKASQKNFQLSMSLKKERETLDEKILRLNKIQEITKIENQRLEFHRRKILNERQNLMKQQGDIENALDKIMSFSGIH